MRKNIHKITKPIAYITATALMAATLFACGNKGDDAAKTKDSAKENSIAEDTKSLKEIFGIVFGDDEDNTDTELETETSIVTEVNDAGEEVTKVVTVIQTEDGTKRVVDNSNNSGNSNNNGVAANNNSSTQKPNGGSGSNGGNSNGSLGNGNSSIGNNTQSGSNSGNNGSSNNSGGGNGNNEVNKPGTSSGNNNNGNTGSSGNAGTTTAASEENDNVGGNISSGGYICTGEKYQGGGSTPAHNFGIQNVAHMHVVKEYAGGLVINAHHSNNYEINLSNNTDVEKALSYPCLEVQYYMLCTCQDCGSYWWEDATGTGFIPGDEYTSANNISYFVKTATTSHNYVEKETRPATYMEYGEIDCVCTKCGDTYFDRNTAKLDWSKTYYETYLGLNGLKTYEDSQVYQYDSQLTEVLMRGHYEEGIDWDTGLVDDNFIVCSFSYIYKRDSVGNPIYEKTILGYDKNGNIIYNDRPYWISSNYEIYKTIADIKSNNPVYSWVNRTADGTLVE